MTSDLKQTNKSIIKTAVLPRKPADTALPPSKVQNWTMLPQAFPPQNGTTAEERSLQSLEYAAGQSLQNGEKMLYLGRSKIELPANTYFLLPVAFGYFCVMAKGSIVAVAFMTILAAIALVLMRTKKDNLGISFILTNKRILEVAKEDIRWQITGEIPLTDITLVQAANKGQGIYIKTKGRAKLLRTDNADTIISLIKQLHPPLVASELVVRAQTAVVVVFVFLFALVAMAVSIALSKP